MSDGIVQGHFSEGGGIPGRINQLVCSRVQLVLGMNVREIVRKESLGNYPWDCSRRSCSGEKCVRGFSGARDVRQKVNTHKYTQRQL